MPALHKVRRRIAARIARHTPFYAWLLPAAPLAVDIGHSGTPASRLAVFLPGIGDHPDEFKQHGFFEAMRAAGVALLAPFLGERSLIREIEQAGGLDVWHPGPATGHHARKLWRWLKQKPSWPPIVLGYGERDTYVQAHRLLAQTLPAEHVAVASRGHEWPTWERLWREKVAEDVLAMFQSGDDRATIGRRKGGAGLPTLTA